MRSPAGLSVHVLVNVRTGILFISLHRTRQQVQPLASSLAGNPEFPDAAKRAHPKLTGSVNSPLLGRKSYCMAFQEIVRFFRGRSN
jgi:hypothetical protein